MRKPVIIFAGIALAALTVGGGVAFADQDESGPALSPPAGTAGPTPGTATPAPDTDDDAEVTSKPAVLAEQAQQTALARVNGGWVTSSDLETEGTTTSWQIEVADGAGAEQEIVVDATTGKILSAAADTDDDQEKDGQDDD
ncbi:PepSY domain-containing protein [Streptosporangium canum]|uniref:PepSY domain-containing protein n=1 Tax=Streptosporangium canum TaxID=324952 RepID=UPI0034169F42